MEFESLFIKEDFIKLDSALKFANLVESGGHAKTVIQNGEVTVNDEICLLRGKKLRENDKVIFNNKGFIIKNADK